MIFRHPGLEARSGDLVWPTLLSAPLDKEAIGEAAKHSQDPYSIITLHPAAVVVVGDVQTLVQATFDAPTHPVEPQPEHRRQQ